MRELGSSISSSLTSILSFLDEQELDRPLRRAISIEQGTARSTGNGRTDWKRKQSFQDNCVTQARYRVSQPNGDWSLGTRNEDLHQGCRGRKGLGSKRPTLNVERPTFNEEDSGAMRLHSLKVGRLLPGWSYPLWPTDVRSSCRRQTKFGEEVPVAGIVAQATQ